MPIQNLTNVQNISSSSTNNNPLFSQSVVNYPEFKKWIYEETIEINEQQKRKDCVIIRGINYDSYMSFIKKFITNYISLWCYT